MKARKLIGTAVLGAALFVPVAQAQSPDDRAGARGPGAIEALQGTNLQHPDNRAVRGVGAQTPPAAPQWMQALEARSQELNQKYGLGAFSATGPASTHPDNRAETRGPGALTTTVVVESTSTGFDWRDALIGGLGGLGTALLLTGCLFLLMSQRKTRTA